MNNQSYLELVQKSLSEAILSAETCYEILGARDIEILPLLNAAFEVRKKYWGKDVLIHIIDNVQNASCPEDCHYCAQSKSSNAEIESYPMKSDDEIFAEAKNACELGAFRHCLVFAGRGSQKERIRRLSGLVKEIKQRYGPMQVCVSAGILDRESIKILKSSGLDRMNHNLNTSERFYGQICTTHTFSDRLNTIKRAKEEGLEICSGVIIGMGEGPQDVIDLALMLRENNVASIPINFLIPIDGNVLKEPKNLTPEYCLRVLCLFRLLNPKAEIRIAAGREFHLRTLEPLSLYPANSLFLDGYLNTKGASRLKTLQMIKDAGFKIKSEYPLDHLLENEKKSQLSPEMNDDSNMKNLNDLRPQLQKLNT